MTKDIQTAGVILIVLRNVRKSNAQCRDLNFDPRNTVKLDAQLPVHFSLVTKTKKPQSTVVATLWFLSIYVFDFDINFREYTILMLGLLTSLFSKGSYCRFLRDSH